jgi:hypothetical protein
VQARDIRDFPAIARFSQIVPQLR